MYETNGYCYWKVDHSTSSEIGCNHGEPAQMTPKGLTRNYLLWTAPIQLNWNLYYQELERLKEAITQKSPALTIRRGIVFRRDDASSQISKWRAKSSRLGGTCLWLMILLVKKSHQEKLMKIDFPVFCHWYCLLGEFHQSLFPYKNFFFRKNSKCFHTTQPLNLTPVA